MKTVILGVGNNLFSDEGIGVHAINYLRHFYENQPTIELLDGGTLGFSLAHYIHSQSNLILIDAMQLHQPAGSVACFCGEEVKSRLQQSSSVHEIGILDLLVMAELTDSMPQRIALIGVQPGSLDWGETLTADVQLALPQIESLVAQLLQCWAADFDLGASKRKVIPDQQNQQRAYAYVQRE